MSGPGCVCLHRPLAEFPAAGWPGPAAARRRRCPLRNRYTSERQTRPAVSLSGLALVSAERGGRRSDKAVLASTPRSQTDVVAYVVLLLTFAGDVHAGAELMPRPGEERVAGNHVVAAVHDVDGVILSAVAIDAAEKFIGRDHVPDGSLAAVCSGNVHVCPVVVAKLIAHKNSMIGGDVRGSVQAQAITMIAAEVRMLNSDAGRAIQVNAAGAI